MTKSKVTGLLFGGIVLFVFMLVVFLIFRTRPSPYPRAVHNACSGFWAIQTGFGIARVVDDPYGFGYGKERDNEALYWGNYTPSLRLHFLVNDTPKPDTTGGLSVGWELTFMDSAMAMEDYTAWVDRNAADVQRQDSIQKVAQIAADRQRKVQDSIFKCQHTYQ